jgi:hypothetical protein
MTGCAAVGVFGKILVEPKASPGDADPVFDVDSERFVYLYETMSTDRKLIGTAGIYGSLSVYGDRLAQQAYVPQGSIGLQPGPADLDQWLPRILGGTKVGNEITIAETLPVFDMLIHRDNGVFRYKNCRVAQAVYRGKSGPTQDESEICNLNISIIAEDEVEAAWPNPEPTLVLNATRVPYTFVQGTYNLAAVSHPFDEFALVINNNLTARNRNSLNPTCVFSNGRTVRLETDNPFTTTNWTSAKNLYTTGAAGSMVFVSGSRSATFAFPLLRAARQTPSARGKGEIPLSIKAQAFRTPSDEEITVTNVSA